MSRNPKRIIYTGEQGWPLHSALLIFQKARACDAELELCVYRTGEKPAAPGDDPRRLYEHTRMIAESERLMKQAGVSESSDLKADMEQSAIWLYPAHVPAPQDGLAGMMAQACGAIPVFTPTGALATEIFAGVPIEGYPALDRMVRCRFAYDIVKLANDVELQESIRVPMMERAQQPALPYDRVQDILGGATKIQGWMTEPELTWLATTAAQMDSVVEIGCWKGRSTVALAASCRGYVWAIDHWQAGKDEPQHIKDEAASGDVRAAFIRNVIEIPNVHVRMESSLEAAYSDEVPMMDFVFIDADHSEEAVRADIRAWRPKARRIMAGHDYDWPSVKAAVDAELGPVQRGPGSIWYRWLKEESLANAAD